MNLIVVYISSYLISMNQYHISTRRDISVLLYIQSSVHYWILPLPILQIHIHTEKDNVPLIITVVQIPSHPVTIWNSVSTKDRQKSIYETPNHSVCWLLRFNNWFLSVFRVFQNKIIGSALRFPNSWRCFSK